MGSTLLLAFLAANPPLTVAERAQLAAPLIEASRVVRKALAAKKVVCVPAVPFDESKPENWLPPEPTAQAGIRQPMNWSRLFNCNSPLGMKQLAVQIYEGAATAPKDKLAASGPGFFLRDFGDYSELALGCLVLFDVNGAMPEPSPPPDGLVFDGPRAVSVGAEVAGWLQWIPRRELLAVLARSTLPEGARPKPPPPPELPRPPPERPYTQAPGPVLRVPADAGPRPGDRAVSANEEAYFSSVAFRAYQAVAKAMAPLGPACRLRTEPAPCSHASWTSQGYVAACWQSAWDCAGGVFLVELEGAAKVGHHPGAVESRGKQARLERNEDSRFDRLLVGALEGPGAVRPANGIAQLGAITFGGDHGNPLFDKLDLAPLLELLNAPPPLPLRPPVAPPGPPIDESTRVERRAEVRRMVLESFVRETTRLLVVADRTSEGLYDERLKEFLANAQPDFDRTAIDDFAAVVAHARSQPPIEFRLPVRLITAAELEDLFPRDGGHDGWANYRTKFPNASGIIHLSEVGLSRDGALAVVTVDWQADWLAGSGETWFLRRTGRGWEKLCVYRRWIS